MKNYCEACLEAGRHTLAEERYADGTGRNFRWLCEEHAPYSHAPHGSGKMSYQKLREDAWELLIAANRRIYYSSAGVWDENRKWLSRPDTWTSYDTASMAGELSNLAMCVCPASNLLYESMRVVFVDNGPARRYAIRAWAAKTPALDVLSHVLVCAGIVSPEPILSYDSRRSKMKLQAWKYYTLKYGLLFVVLIVPILCITWPRTGPYVTSAWHWLTGWEWDATPDGGVAWGVSMSWLLLAGVSWAVAFFGPTPIKPDRTKREKKSERTDVRGIVREELERIYHK